ncbi:hypothetical protein NPZ10_14400, partial [Salmonella enterica]|nr:hypothetical protein [Salmonella enterica]
RGCNPTSSKFIHTWLRFGEIMRGSLRVLHPEAANEIRISKVGEKTFFYSLNRQLYNVCTAQ